MSRRSPETLADYLAIAVCPFLIFLLVCSLMFFLVEVFFQGEYKLRLQFVMAMFCMAIVCIARIAMEEGSSYATLFAFPLGVAVGVAIIRFVPGGIVIGLPLMGIVWWATHKLTWDCTLVDDSQEASGQGLLQEMGLDPLAAGVPSGPAGTTTRATIPEATTGTAESEKAWWQNLLEPDRRPHSPGIWVVYFSLAALPLFGFGGWFVPASEPEARTRVFQYLLVYVASGLGLLLFTSFLGLRRYLRQRNLEMPAEMTGTWIAVGVGLIALTLIVAAILPSTKAEYSLAQLPVAFTSAVRQASRFGVGPDGTSDTSNPDAARTDAHENQSSDRGGGSKGESQTGQSGKSKAKGKGKGKPGEQSGGDAGGGQQGNAQSSDQNDQSANEKGNSQGKNSEGKGADSKGQSQQSENSQQGESNKAGEQKSEGGSQSQNPQEQPQQPASRPFANFNISQALFTLIKWLFWLALLVASAVAGWIYREQLAAAWQKLLAELRDLWARWFGDKTKAAQPEALFERPTPPRPFAAFSDPFANGDAARMPWPELVRYSFAAVEAWARERECARHDDQTPHEFAQSLAALEPQLAAPVQSLAGWYGQLAYAPRAAAGSLEPIKQLWRELRAAPTPHTATSP